MPTTQRIIDAAEALLWNQQLEAQGKPAAQLESHGLPPRGIRRQKNLLRSFPGITAAVLEDRERQAWITKIIQILTDGETPVVQLAAGSDDPRRIITGALGSTRVGTLSMYTRSFQAFVVYLVQAFGVRWPETMSQVLDYLHARAAEPCSPSVPQVFMQALAWFERTASIPPSLQFNKADILRRTVDSVLELVACGSGPSKQAPRSY